MSAPESRVLAVVPARGGSDGGPGMTLAEVGGSSLLAHAVRFAASVPQIARCVVSTDDEAVAAAAGRAGSLVTVRPWGECAADDAPPPSIVRQALDAAEAAGERFDTLVVLAPSTPVRRAEDVSRAIALLAAAEGSVDGVAAVSEPPFHPSFVGVRETGEGVCRYFGAAAGMTRRQEAGRFLRVTGQFYVWRADFARRVRRDWLDGRHLTVETDDAQAVTVRTPTDLERLRRLVDARLLQLPTGRESAPWGT